MGVRRLTGAMISVAVTGCGPLLGIDEYGVGHVGPGIPTCKELESLDPGGKCVRVGVDQCADGWKTDGRGGCVPKLDGVTCDSGTFFLPTSSECVAPVQCGGRVPMQVPTGTVYVRAGSDGDGTVEKPFGSIEAALSALKGAPAASIALYEGTHQVNAIIDRKLRLAGNCVDGTLIEPRDPTQPALRFVPRSDGSEVSGARITSTRRTPAVVVDGATGIALSSVRILRTEGPALLVEDTSGPASASFTSSSIEEATGAGVEVYGGALTIDATSIRGTRPQPGGLESCGICLHPSATRPLLPQTAGAPPTLGISPAESPRPSLRLSGSTVEDNAGAGILVEGGDLTVQGSVLRDTPAGESQRIGIDARERLAGSVPATVTVSNTLLDALPGAGIRALDARVNVTGSVFRNIGAGNAAGVEPCLGNGVRARVDYAPGALPDSGLPPPPAPDVTIERSLFDRTREAAIHIEGTVLHLDRVLVRDTAKSGCRGGFGDGVAIYSYPFSTAKLELKSSRIQKSARAAVASFDAPVSIDGAVFDGNAREVVVTSESSPSIDFAHAACGNSALFHECTSDRDPRLERSVFSSACGKEPDRVCGRACLTDITSASGTTGVPGVRIWISNHDEIAPAVTDDSDGCAEYGGIPPGEELLAVYAKTGYAPISSPFTSGLHDAQKATFRIMGSDLIYFNFFPGTVYPQRPEFDGLDLRRSLSLGSFACEPVPSDAPSGFDPCQNRGVPGVRVELDPPGGVGTYCTGDNGLLATLDATTTGGISGALCHYIQVPPGDRIVRLVPEDPNTSIDCTLDARGDGWLTGWTTTEKNTYRLPWRPGVITGMPAFCSVRPR